MVLSTFLCFIFHNSHAGIMGTLLESLYEYSKSLIPWLSSSSISPITYTNLFYASKFGHLIVTFGCICHWCPYPLVSFPIKPCRLFDALSHWASEATLRSQCYFWSICHHNLVLQPKDVWKARSMPSVCLLARDYMFMNPFACRFWLKSSVPLRSKRTRGKRLANTLFHLRLFDGSEPRQSNFRVYYLCLVFCFFLWPR